MRLGDRKALIAALQPHWPNDRLYIDDNHVCREQDWDDHRHSTVAILLPHGENQLEVVPWDDLAERPYAAFIIEVAGAGFEPHEI